MTECESEGRGTKVRQDSTSLSFRFVQSGGRVWIHISFATDHGGATRRLSHCVKRLISETMAPTDTAISTAMRETGVRYHQEVQQKTDTTRREQLGPPHDHVFEAIVASLVTQLTSVTPQPAFHD